MHVAAAAMLQDGFAVGYSCEAWLLEMRTRAVKHEIVERDRNAHCQR